MDNYNENGNMPDNKENSPVENEEPHGVKDGIKAEENSFDVDEKHLTEVLKKRRENYNRAPLIIALFGMITSVFYGVGIIPSVISLIIGAVRYKRNKSKPLIWAIVISVCSIALSVCFISAVLYAGLLAKSVPVIPFEN